MCDEDQMQRLCRRLFELLDENVDLRHLAMDMAAGLPLDQRQRALLDAVFGGRWTR